MDWFGAGGNGPLIVARAIHFAATAITAGSLIFGAVVARPALRSKEAEARPFRAQTLVVAWLGLAIAAASGVIWFLLQAAAMSGLPLGEAMESGALSTVLNQTQFGQVSEIRFALAMMLAACLACDRFPLANGLALAAAFGLTGAIAWTGHAGSTLGETGNLHLIADGLHLLAAAAWIGGLVSLVLLLVTAQRNQRVAWASLVQAAVRRFSSAGHRQRGDSVGDRHGQRMDSCRLVSRAGRHRIWAAPDAQDRCFRRHAGVCCPQPALADATADLIGE